MSERSRVVVITGASAGVGRAAALAFAKQGDRVGLIARSMDGLKSASDEIAAAGGTSFAHAADVSNPDELRRAADAIEEALGPIDVWVNNAMVDDPRPDSGAATRRGAPRHRGDLSRNRSRNDDRAGAHARAGQGPDHPGRLGARLPFRAASGAVLRRKSGDPRIYQLACAAS